METTENAQGRAMTPDAAFRADRTIALSLPFGVALFWGLSLALNSAREESSIMGLDVGVATIVVAALALAALIAAFMLRLGAVAAMERRSGGMSEAADFGAFRTRLVLSWALLEAPALLAGVVHFMWGAERVLLYVGPLYLLGVALTFPRADWYGAGRSGGALR